MNIVDKIQSFSWSLLLLCFSVLMAGCHQQVIDEVLPECEKDVSHEGSFVRFALAQNKFGSGTTRAGGASVRADGINEHGTAQGTENGTIEEQSIYQLHILLYDGDVLKYEFELYDVDTMFPPDDYLSKQTGKNGQVAANVLYTTRSNISGPTSPNDYIEPIERSAGVNYGLLKRQMDGGRVTYTTDVWKLEPASYRLVAIANTNQVAHFNAPTGHPHAGPKPYTGAQAGKIFRMVKDGPSGDFYYDSMLNHANIEDAGQRKYSTMKDYISYFTLVNFADGFFNPEDITDSETNNPGTGLHSEDAMFTDKHRIAPYGLVALVDDPDFRVPVGYTDPLRPFVENVSLTRRVAKLRVNLSNFSKSTNAVSNLSQQFRLKDIVLKSGDGYKLFDVFPNGPTKYSHYYSFNNTKGVYSDPTNSWHYTGSVRKLLGPVGERYVSNNDNASVYPLGVNSEGQFVPGMGVENTAFPLLQDLVRYGFTNLGSNDRRTVGTKDDFVELFNVYLAPATTGYNSFAGGASGLGTLDKPLSSFNQPVQNTGESDVDYAKRLDEWRNTAGYSYLELTFQMIDPTDLDSDGRPKDKGGVTGELKYHIPIFNPGDIRDPNRGVWEHYAIQPNRLYELNIRFNGRNIEVNYTNNLYVKNWIIDQPINGDGVIEVNPFQ